MKLSEVAVGRNNNWDCVRLIASFLVLAAHAFPVATGANGDLLFLVSNGNLNFGGFAVLILFLFSGYFNAKSVERVKGDFYIFFKSRALRLIPELLCVCLFCMFVIGPIFTDLTIVQYFSDYDTYLYPINSLLLGKHELPGVFTNNVYASQINGSLWTLKLEVLCYIGVFIAYKLKMFNKKGFFFYIVMYCIGIVLYSYLLYNNSPLSGILYPILGFGMGIALYVCREYIKLSAVVALIAMLLYLVTCRFKFGMMLGLITLSYAMLYIVFATKKKIGNVTKGYEISYGVYLWAFPIQQIICYMFGGRMNPYVNIIMTIPIVVLVAIASNKFIQRPVLKKFGE